MDILNLKDLEVLKVEENEFDYLITAQAKDRPEFCIRCYHNNLIKHSTNERIISDVCIHSKRTKIQLIHRRYLNKFDMFLLRLSQGSFNLEIDLEEDSTETFIEYEG